MSSPSFGVVSLGNALVDILSPVSEAFIAQQKTDHGMEKGAMTLIEETRAAELYAQLQDATETAGGSAANTMAGFASFGGKGGFIGKTNNDTLGQSFGDSLKEIGVTFNTPPLTDGPATGRCMVLITPDAQRTMNTFLGASIELSANDVDTTLIEDAQIIYLEGYLFDREKAKQAFVKAAETAHKAGRKVALSLSDPFCVDRHRESFLHLVEHHIDILFANEDEIKSLYQKETFEEAAAAVSKHVEIAALTRSEKGAVIQTADQAYTIPAAAVEQVIDTTGAGDQFAAGFLYGLTEGLPLTACGNLGALAAAEVISHIGPRPKIALSSFLDKAA